MNHSHITINWKLSFVSFINNQITSRETIVLSLNRSMYVFSTGSKYVHTLWASRVQEYIHFDWPPTRKDYGKIQEGNWITDSSKNHLRFNSNFVSTRSQFLWESDDKIIRDSMNWYPEISIVIPSPTIIQINSIHIISTSHLLNVHDLMDEWLPDSIV